MLFCRLDLQDGGCRAETHTDSTPTVATNAHPICLGSAARRCSKLAIAKKQEQQKSSSKQTQAKEASNPAKQKLSNNSSSSNHKQACKSQTNGKTNPHLLGCQHHGFAWRHGRYVRLASRRLSFAVRRSASAYFESALCC